MLDAYWTRHRMRVGRPHTNLGDISGASDGDSKCYVSTGNGARDSFAAAHAMSVLGSAQLTLVISSSKIGTVACISASCQYHARRQYPTWRRQYRTRRRQYRTRRRHAFGTS
eukprot:1162808-Rhodomonas_salina.2